MNESRYYNIVKKIGIVILNYLNYKDTIECIESIYDMQYNIEGIVVVDNHSYNESYNILKNRFRQYKNITIIRTKKNYGFAKGNNVGIRVVKKNYNVDFVFVVNNDVVFRRRDYFEQLMKHYRAGIGVMGTQIYLKGNRIQNIYSGYVDLTTNIILYISDFLECMKLIRLESLIPSLKMGERKKILHGCALLFTPEFFQYYQGFYSKTFLYNEETILYLMCERYNLKQIYVEDTYLFHKEDQSSKESFKNENAIMSKYRLQGRKYVIWWIIKNKINRLFYQ